MKSPCTKAWRRLRTLFRNEQLDAEMADEMRVHLELQAAENERRGMSPEEARSAARRAFGDVEQIKERARDQRGRPWLEELRQDVRYACRMLRRTPGFSAVVILTLALGIGACTAIFSVVNSVLLRPIAYPESERLVVLSETRGEGTFSPAPANYLDWSSQTTDLFENMYAQRSASYSLTGRGEPVRVAGARVTGNYFATLRAPPLLGRVIGVDDDTAGASVVVLGHAFWQKQFGGRSEALGETVQLDGWPHAIVGVMPPEFQKGSAPDLFVPMAFTASQAGNRNGHRSHIGARLRPGVTLEQAQARMAVVAARLARQHPKTNRDLGVVVRSQLENDTGGMHHTLFTLLAAVALLLCIASANVANLLLARGATRQREIAVRTALGASRWRIARQLLVEHLVLAWCGGLLGVMLGRWGLDVLLAIAPDNLPRVAEVTLDGRALAVALGVTLAIGLGFGSLPAWQGSRVQLVPALKDGSRGASDGGRRQRMRQALVVCEIALALMLLTGSGLLVRGFARLMAFDPGFRPEGMMMAEVFLPPGKYATPEKRAAFVDAVVERYRALPGVTAAGAVHFMPMSTTGHLLGIEIEGRAIPPGAMSHTNYFAVTPDYFRTMGLRLLRGRFFDERDRAGGAPVTLISQAVADRHFPGVDPIGRRIMAGEGRIWREIVGVVSDVKHRMGEIAPQTYTPFAQTPFARMTFVVRADADFTALAPALRREVQAIDPDQPLALLQPVTELLVTATARQKFALTLFGVFSTLALLLSAVGIYGIMAYAVAQRTVEFGIRLALGARPVNLFSLVLRQGGKLIACGVAVGLAGALAATRFIESLLYQTSVHDPLVFAGVVGLLAAVAGLACLIPAIRAARVDPIVALQSE